MKRFMYPGDPRLEIVNGMLTQPKLFIGPEAYGAAKSLAFGTLYSAPAQVMTAMYGSQAGFLAMALNQSSDLTVT